MHVVNTLRKKKPKKHTAKSKFPIADSRWQTACAACYTSSNARHVNQLPHNSAARIVPHQHVTDVKGREVRLQSASSLRKSMQKLLAEGLGIVKAAQRPEDRGQSLRCKHWDPAHR